MQYFCSNVLLFKKKKMCKEYPYTIKKIFLRSSNDQTNFYILYLYIIVLYSMHLDEHLHSSCKQLKFTLDGIE